MRRLALLVVLAGCPNGGPGPDFTFTGGYEDWDSTDQDFLGVNGATVTEVGNPSNTATTAPNGRSTLILPGETSQVTYAATAYLPARYTVEPAAHVDPYSIRGITETRIATLYQDELSVGAWDPGSVLVEIAVPDGVSVTLDGETGTPYGDGFVLFPDVAPGDGRASLEVDGGGLTCHAPSEIFLVAGEVAITTIACD